MAMKLSTGKVAFPIEFDNGDKACIYFNPNDPDFASRLMSVKDKISNRIKSVGAENLEISANGETIVNYKNVSEFSAEEFEAAKKHAEKSTKAFDETKKIICEELNEAFGSDVSTVVFKYCSPFAIVEGQYYIVYFLESILPEIQKSIEKTNKTAEKKMSKYIEKYRK